MSKEEEASWRLSRLKARQVTPLEWAGSSRRRHLPVDSFQTYSKGSRRLAKAWRKLGECSNKETDGSFRSAWRR